MSKSGNRGGSFAGEESPSSIGQWCQITSGGGDSKDSATESYRPLFQRVRVERRGKSSPAAW